DGRRLPAHAAGVDRPRALADGGPPTRAALAAGHRAEVLPGGGASLLCVISGATLDNWHSVHYDLGGTISRPLGGRWPSRVSRLPFHVPRHGSRAPDRQGRRLLPL